MSLFLKEQYLLHEQKVLTHLNSHENLKESLSQIDEIKVKLNTLEEEIESDPNVETLREVIKSSHRQQDSIEDAIENMPPTVRFLFVMFRELNKALSSTFNTIK